MTGIYGLFAEPEAVQRAVDMLRRSGIANHDITVVSDEPYEEFEFSHRDKATWLFPLAALGGLIGLIGATLLTVGTERAWPLDVGGMPVVALWPNLVITFELTMLGAILTTVGALLVTAKLPAREPVLYDPEVSNGRILVGVSHLAGPAEAVRSTLEQNGALEVKTAG
jgi:Alternative complex III, ActD subunit